MSVTIPTSGVDLFSDEVLEDPYPAYAALRELGPAVWLERHKAWAIPRYEEVRAALRDHETFSSEPNPGLEPEQPYMPRGDILSTDPPVHEQLRAVLASQLGPRALRDLRERIADAADALVADVAAHGTFDVVPALARRLPMDIVSDLVGLGDVSRDKLFAFADAAFNTFGPLNGRTQESLGTVMSMLEFMHRHEPRGIAPGQLGRCDL